MDLDPDGITAAETRLEARSRDRRRRAERRARRERILLWVLAPFVLPLAGAAAAGLILDSAGGDLDGWTTSSVWLATAAVFGLPAALTAWLARRRPGLEPLGWAAITLLAELALVFWVVLVALGLGPG